MVATPIGNLADISLRAVHILNLVDAVACEDTRHTGALLGSLGMHKPLIALHEHNEREAAATVVERLRRGERIAYVSDAGTPGISDPGARLAASLQREGLRCMPIPGASSVTALLSASGLEENTSGSPGRFVFFGFLPAKGADRKKDLERVAGESRTCVLLEAPHRIETLARELAEHLVDRPVTIGRELTKQFEEIAQVQAQAMPAWLKENAQRTRGEFALVIHPLEEAPAGDGDKLDPKSLQALKSLLPHMPLKAAVKLCAELTGAPRNALYDAALAMRDADSDEA